MPAILFIAAHRPGRSPSQRFRFEQYIPFLQKNGYRCDLSYLISDKDDKRFYSQGNYLHKFSVLLKSTGKRLSDIRRAGSYDIVFIQREAFMLGITYFEKKLSSSGAKIVFDFDDSIWMPNVSEGNRNLEWMKNYSKTSEIIALSDMVFAGNAYLAGYARQYNKNVEIVPTTIDTAEYIRVNDRSGDEKVCIGWSGSITTIRHFEYAVPFLKTIKGRFENQVTFRVIGDGNYANAGLGIRGMPWKRDTEIQDLSGIDIGIMPLPDDEWAKGKCGLKGLQYMALETPTVMSPVGVNTEIIEHGKNGFLADSEEEWVSIISALTESPELRWKIGREARKTVEERYSVSANSQLYLNYFDELLGRYGESS